MLPDKKLTPSGVVIVVAPPALAAPTSATNCHHIVLVGEVAVESEVQSLLTFSPSYIPTLVYLFVGGLVKDELRKTDVADPESARGKQ